MSSIDGSTIATHNQPVGRGRTNFIMLADLGEHGLPGKYEQLWFTDLGNGEFELACLPFFVYGLALGDVVEAKRARRGFIVGRTVRHSGHRVLRVFLQDPTQGHEDLHAAVIDSCRMNEWRASGLVAIDVESSAPDALWAVISDLVGRKLASVEWSDAG